jgi:ATP-dependent RNA helicase DDX55/SPB4
VDFADVDVVIQYDPPTDPKTFSHRAGRTARAGRKGKAVILLGKGREEEYVDFLGARKIPVMPQGRIGSDLLELEVSQSAGSAGLPEVEEQALSLMAEIRTRLSSDRDLNDRAAKAFVSALRAYTKHEASFIFRVADVDFADWATAYGLLRLPAMPEVKDWRKRVAARKEADLKSAEAGEAVTRANDLEWKDAEVDVSCLQVLRTEGSRDS